MTEMEKKIIKEIKETQIEAYGNYSFIDAVKCGISRAMFGKDAYGLRCYEYAYGWKNGVTKIRDPQLITDEQLEKVEKVYENMMAKGFFKKSKSGVMVKLVKEN